MSLNLYRIKSSISFLNPLWYFFCHRVMIYYWTSVREVRYSVNIRRGCRGSTPGRGRHFCGRYNVRTGCGERLDLYPSGTEALSLGVRRPGREPDHWPPSFFEVENTCSCTCTFLNFRMQFWTERVDSFVCVPYSHTDTSSDRHYQLQWNTDLSTSWNLT
jgi:hypothetical protein